MTGLSVPVRLVQTPTLDIAYEERGPADGAAIILLHGFPYDPRCYDAVVPDLAAAGYRVIVPYLRGYGRTTFRSTATVRSGQQAALAKDLLDLLDALAIPCAAMAGYDWGGRAACIVAALRPERVRCLVTGNGYNVHDIPNAGRPADPEQEHRLWYQYYFHSQRGRDGLAVNRRALGKCLWRQWSPSWAFDDATYDRTAASFDTADFVEVVIHSYRQRYGYAPGDPAFEGLERDIAAQPKIVVPTISLWGTQDGVWPPSAEDHHRVHFAGRYERRLLPGVGHNIPQEAPAATVAAVLDLLEA